MESENGKLSCYEKLKENHDQKFTSETALTCMHTHACMHYTQTNKLDKHTTKTQLRVRAC